MALKSSQQLFGLDDVPNDNPNDNPNDVSDDAIPRNCFLTHVFVEVDASDVALLSESIETQESIRWNTFPHISLHSALFALRYHERPLFAEHIRQVVRQLRSFTVCLSEFRVFPNENKTRLFVVLCERIRSPEADALLTAVGRAFDLFPNAVLCGDRLAVSEFSLHISVASTDVSDDANKLQEELENHFEEPLIIRIERIVLKMGNEFEFFSLIN